MQDVSSVLPLVSLVSRKLKLLSENTMLQTVQTCQLIFSKLIELENSPVELKLYFECLGLCLNKLTKSEMSRNGLTIIFAIIEQTYCTCSKK